MKNELNLLLDALSQETLARKINDPHDGARGRYTLQANRVSDYTEYERIIGEYYNYHFTATRSSGGSLADYDACEAAKELIDGAYRHQGKEPGSAYKNAHNNYDGGMKAILDIIAEGLKQEQQRRYMNNILDRYVRPHEFNEQVEIIRQFLTQCGAMLGGEVEVDRPERYAKDYKALIHLYLQSVQKINHRFLAY